MTDDYIDREQSQIKHVVLRKYLEAASRIIGSSQDLIYVDCFAGPWESRARDYSDTSFGIAIEVLKRAHQELKSKGKNPTFKALLIEKRRTAFASLQEFALSATCPEVQVEAKNWDFTDHVSEAVEIMRRSRAFSFTFVDPTGWSSATPEVLEPILKVTPGEVLINFMSSFVTRFIQDSELKALKGDDREDEIVQRYRHAISRKGDFPYVCALPVMKRDHDAFHFHLVYATRNLEGVRVFKEVEKQTEITTQVVRANRQMRERVGEGMQDLFTPEVLYRRERRYQKLASKNQELAKKAVWRLIKRRKELDYDELYAEALQFATVRQDDLRNWLSKAQGTGRISVAGLRTSSEKLKIKSGHRVLVSASTGSANK